MRFSQTIPLVLTSALLMPAFAQDHGMHMDSGNTGRTFALVQGNDVSLNGSWQHGDALSRYAHEHAGHYIVFLDGDQLHRMDSASDVTQAEQAYAPMLPLEVRQKALADQQKPLSDQQRTLAEQQRAAVGNPAEQGRIGQEQGDLGRQQGEIGRKQGEIGRQQGEVARAFYAKVQTMINTCLANNTCPRVTS